jgi:CxxC-x17-CxxC domain-containing protein
VGSILVMRVGGEDALFLENEFTPTFTPEDMVNLPKYQMYLKLMVNGVATAPFSASTLSPIANRTASEEKVINVSRERYAEARASIEEKVLRWSGMEATESSDGVFYPEIITEEERAVKDEKAEAQEGDSSSEEYLKISPERMEAMARPTVGKKEKPKFSHTCSRCGKVWDMPIKLDPTRPIYCSECLPLVREEQKNKKNVMKTAFSSIRTSSSDSGEEKKSEDAELVLEPEKQAVKTVSEKPDDFSNDRKQNRPRIVGKPKVFPPAPDRPRQTGNNPRLNREETSPNSLIKELERSKGRRIETDKRKLDGRRDSRPAQNPPNRPTIMPQQAPRVENHTQEIKSQPTVLTRDLNVVTNLSPDYEARTRTVFKSAVSSVSNGQAQNNQSSNAPRTIKPGEKVTF